MYAKYPRLLLVLTTVALLAIPAPYSPDVVSAASVSNDDTMAAGHDTAVPQEFPPPPDDFPGDDLEPQTPSLGQVPALAEKVAWPIHRLPTTPGGMTWSSQGPAPILNGQVENIPPLNDVDGAIHTVATHPTDPDILFIGAVNGGIWRTLNATDSNPTWTPLTDDAPSLSIGALEFDPTDVTSQTLVAGIGRYSAFSQHGGDRTGLLRTTDSGDTWTPITGTLLGKNISGVAPRGNTIVVSVNVADDFIYDNIGIFRSTNGGTSFDQISSGNGITTGLPSGAAYDLVGDPTDNSRLFTAMVYADWVGGQNGVYRSDDTGATWTKVSNAAMDNLITSIITTTGTNNIEMAVGYDNNVYVAIINTGQLAGIFRSGDGGSMWTAMDVPTTNENGTDIGIHPKPKPGSQGGIHFSIVVDPNDTNVVYVGGDRQPDANEGSLPPIWPNSIGAYDYSGRLFRGDASQPSGSQWVHLTHTPTITIPTGGTASSSAPHADSREMVFDANGDIIEVDDGGIYRRTSPQDNTGDWFSMNGNLQVTEFHHIAYDTNADIIIGGTQDTGTPEQTTTGSMTWNSISTGDGGDVAVDVLSLAGIGQSIRYSSYYRLGGFRGHIYDAGNSYVSTFYPTLIVSGTGLSLSQADPNIQFYQPFELNAVDPTRGVLGTASVYETLDRFDTLTDISGFTSYYIYAMAYGGFLGSVPYPDVLYFGAGGLYLRTSLGGPITPLTAYPGTIPIDIVLDPDDWQTAYVVDDSNQVHVTNNAGTSWRTITGNLVDSGLETCAFISGARDMLVVGGRSGVSVMATDDEGVWSEFAAGLPRAPVYELDYDATDDILLAGTLGRGAWLIHDASTAGLSPDLTIAKSVSQDVAAPGALITYTLTFSNASGGLATDVLIMDTMPVSVTTVSVISAGVAITNTGYSPPYIWQVQDLAPGEDGVIVIVGQLSDTLPHNHVFTNTAVITSTAVETDTVNNTSVAAITIDSLPPTAPTLLSPPDGTITSTTELALIWQASPSPDVAGYLLDFDGTLNDVGNTTSISGVLGAGTYTWTVAAYDGVYNISPYTDVWSFTVEVTTLPDPPVLSSPADGTVTSTTELTLTWQASPSPDVTGYLLDFNGTIIDVGNTTFSTTGVLADGIYTWTVAAYNATSTGPYTDVWSFTVESTTPTTQSVYLPLALNNYDPSQLLQNRDFDTGDWAPWQIIESPVLDNQMYRSAPWSARLAGRDNVDSDYVYQEVTVPSNATEITLDFWYRVSSTDPAPADYLCVEILDSGFSTVLFSLGCPDLYSVEPKNQWIDYPFVLTGAELAPLLGQTVLVSFQGWTDATNPSTVWIDDASFKVTGTGP